MIYEKKGFAATNTKPQSVTVSGIYSGKGSVTEYSKQAIIPAVYKPEAKRRIRKRAKLAAVKKRKKRWFSKLAVSLCTLIFCLSVIDTRFLDGMLLDKAKEYVRNQGMKIYTGVSNTGEKNTENVTDEEYMYNLSDYEVSEGNETQDSQINITDSSGEVSESLTSPVSWTEKASAAVDGERYFPITQLDLSADSVAVLSNATSYTPDMDEVINDSPDALENLVIDEDEPLVLIVHTHACESYTEHTQFYPQSESTRSEDTEKNVVRVGKEIADILESYNIPAIHCTKLCDKESFIDAYSVSHDTVKEYLEQYPSIKVVIDVHRDAIIKQSGESIKPTVNIAGQDYAQLMLVMGTDQAGHSHPHWKENLSFAAALQEKTNERYPGLFRPINLRTVPFNQWLSTGYILLEVGSNSNTLEEALLSAQAFAHSLCCLLKENC